MLQYLLWLGAAWLLYPVLRGFLRGVGVLRARLLLVRPEPKNAVDELAGKVPVLGKMPMRGVVGANKAKAKRKGRIEAISGPRRRKGGDDTTSSLTHSSGYSAETINKDQGMTPARLTSIRDAAAVHKSVRALAQRVVKPGMLLRDVCTTVESETHRLLGFDPTMPLVRSWGFPTGCSVNHVAAHYTPNPGDLRRLRAKDLVKLDFGVQINGNIIDCAFSFSFDPMHDQLMEAVKDATNSAIKAAGVGVRMGDIGRVTSEVMDSYEVTYGGKTQRVKPLRNLTGHSIGLYRIHSGESVPQFDNWDPTKMKAGQMYAIETFGTTGRGSVFATDDCSHFMLNYSSPPGVFHPTSLLSPNARELREHIAQRYSSLAFCRRWLHDAGYEDTKYYPALQELVAADIITPYPPLSDAEGSFTAQYEQTVVFHENGKKEVVSRDHDF